MDHLDSTCTAILFVENSKNMPFSSNFPWFHQIYHDVITIFTYWDGNLIQSHQKLEVYVELTVIAQQNVKFLKNIDENSNYFKGKTSTQSTFYRNFMSRPMWKSGLRSHICYSIVAYSQNFNKLFFNYNVKFYYHRMSSQIHWQTFFSLNFELSMCLFYKGWKRDKRQVVRM